jgi:hypothetical protein
VTGGQRARLKKAVLKPMLRMPTAKNLSGGITAARKTATKATSSSKAAPVGKENWDVLRIYAKRIETAVLSMKVSLQIQPVSDSLYH